MTRALWRDLHKLWGVPIWPDGTALTAEAASGQAVLSVGQTDYRRFYDGGRCILIDPQNPLTYETGIIDSVASTSITLDANLSTTWPAGISVYPLIEGRLSASQSIQLQSYKTAGIDIEVTETFESGTDHHAVSPSQSVTQYEGYDVFLYLPNLISSKIGVEHDYQVLEYLGPSYSDSNLDESAITLAATFTRSNRVNLWDIWTFFDVHKGRYGHFWVPSFQRDIQVTAGFTSTATTFHITDIEYSDYWLPNDATGRHLFFRFPDGTYVFRAVTGATDTTLTIDSAIGVACATADLDRLYVGFLHFCRFSIDELTAEYKFKLPTAADLNLKFVTIPFEAPAI
ncbi:hypothetical protein DSCOOX_52270 [Desulfosarcina ovata subsp. ovata]|uniref:Uncharacterized protein n=1 Tax=Desulfosarcina ovata subsp. ovata TaxID=2752305 RepID=A0A5K8AHB4_9BACT|nr:hypothetical protein DSCOOX_52270 [Desulfosarcina ovata subsp. ovata]